MLSTLSVSNFAIIDNITIDFDNHLSVLTGETGAGKSLIIDAIGLLLGDRASSSLVRRGSTKAIIEGVFTGYNPQIDQLLDEFGIEILDDMLIIKREINDNGKSISRINGSIVTLSQLEAISGMLADIHTQLDTKKLFDLRNYVDFLDDDESLELLKNYQGLRKGYLEAIDKYQSLVDELKTNQDNLDFYQYRLQELKGLHLQSDEVKNLEQELYVLNNYETIYQQLALIKSLFSDQGITNSLYQMKNALEKLNQYDEGYKELVDVVNNSYYDLDDVESQINNRYHNLEFDSDRLNEINERLNTLKDIQRKYKMDIDQLIAYQEELANKINAFEQSDIYLEDAKKAVDQAYQEVLSMAKRLSNRRKENALYLQKSIMATLKDLCLDKVTLDIHFGEVAEPLKPTDFMQNGIDDVQFMISFNVGEPLRPLSKVASGGEMSRVMLALKAHLFQNAKLSTVIFDEIDTGISGEVAASVARKLKLMSEKMQVLAITHLPIVAAAADQHLFVQKEVVGDRTVTKISKLNKEERITELSKMISSNKEDLTSQMVAENMINQYRK